MTNVGKVVGWVASPIRCLGTRGECRASKACLDNQARWRGVTRAAASIWQPTQKAPYYVDRTAHSTQHVRAHAETLIIHLRWAKRLGWTRQRPVSTHHHGQGGCAMATITARCVGQSPTFCSIDLFLFSFSWSLSA